MKEGEVMSWKNGEEFHLVEGAHFLNVKEATKMEGTQK